MKLRVFIQVGCQFSVALFFFFICSLNVLAETENVNGIDFQYDFVQEVDRNQIEIKVLGKNHIVKKDNLANFLAEQYFFNSNVSFSFEEINTFYQQSIANNNLGQAFSALRVASQSDQLSWEQIAEFFFTSNQEQIKKLAKFDISQDGNAVAKSSKLGQYFVYLAKEHYDPELIASCCRDQSTNKSFFKFLVLQAIKTAKSIEELTPIFSYFNDTIGKTTEYNDLKAFSSLYFQAIENPNNFNNFFVESQSKYPELTKQLGLTFQQHQEQFLQESIENNQLQDALNYLLLFDLTKRTENTHQLIIDLIKKIDINTAGLLLVNRYRDLFFQLSEKDPNIKKVLIAKHEELIISLLKRDQGFRSNDYISNLFLLRPNPHPVNSKILFYQLYVFHRKGLERQASLVFKNPNFKPTYQQRIWLLHNDFYINFNLLFGLTLLLTVILLYLFLKERGYLQSWLSREAFSNGTNGDQQTKENIEKQFSQLNPNWHRYGNLLAVLELDQNASLEDIKSAYRQKMKMYHPDLNPEQSPEDQQAFLELKEQYESILKLYNVLHNE